MTTPRMDEEHEQGIRDALRAWLRVQVGPVTKEDRSQMLEQMRAKAFQVFGPARRSEPGDRFREHFARSREGDRARLAQRERK